MKTSLSICLIVCGTLLIVSPWAGVVAETLAMGSIMASRSDLTSISLGNGQPFGIASVAFGVVMIVFACWKAQRAPT